MDTERIDACADPIEKLTIINSEVDHLLLLRRETLFEARLQGRLDEAITVTGLSRKRALAETRHENEARGRMVRWGES